MATTAPVFEERRVSIGRVFQRALSSIALNPVVVLGLALLIGALPGFIMTYLLVQTGVGNPAALQNGTTSFGAIMTTAFISSVIGMVIAAIVQGALTRAVVSANKGRRASFGECVAAGMRVILPLIGLSILFAIGVGIGFILLIVPGIILLLMWAVAVPALVIERPGVFGAFGRSSELTKGARWKIFGLLLVLIVIYWLLSVVVGLVGLGMYSPSTATAGLSVANLIGSILVGTVFNVIWGTIQPSLYLELREWKEGGSIENLEDVFA